MGEDPPPFPFSRPELGWRNKSISAGWQDWGVESLAAGGYGFPAPASLFLGTVFLAAGMGPTWGTEASGQAAV